MSGVFCGGCGEGDLRADPGGPGRTPVACDICGWKADKRGLPDEWWEDEDVAPRTKRQRKEAGLLFFLWVDVASDDARSKVMRILGLTSISGGSRVLLELGSRPSEDELQRLAHIPGVSGVRLVP